MAAGRACVARLVSCNDFDAISDVNPARYFDRHINFFSGWTHFVMPDPVFRKTVTKRRERFPGVFVARRSFLVAGRIESHAKGRHLSSPVITCNHLIISCHQLAISLSSAVRQIAVSGQVSAISSKV